MINGMKIYTSKQLVAALKEAGFTEIKTYSNAKNHWISIVAVSYTHLDVYKRQGYYRTKRRTKKG